MRCAGNARCADIMISVILRHNVASSGRIEVVVQVPQGVGVEGCRHGMGGARKNEMREPISRCDDMIMRRSGVRTARPVRSKGFIMTHISSLPACGAAGSYLAEVACPIISSSHVSAGHLFDALIYLMRWTCVRSRTCVPTTGCSTSLLRILRRPRKNAQGSLG